MKLRKLLYEIFTSKDFFDCSRIENVDAEILDVLLLYFFSYIQRVGKKCPILFVLPDLNTAERVYYCFRWFLSYLEIKCDAVFFPEFVDKKHLFPNEFDIRIRAFHKIVSTNPDIIITTVNSLLSSVPSPEAFTKKTVILETGEDINFSKLLENLVDMDYDDEPEVQITGEFSVRGGILDIFSPAHDSPVRIEFFGNTIESMRFFDVNTQRSIKTANRYTVIPKQGWSKKEKSSIDFLSYIIRKINLVLIFNEEECENRIKEFLASVETKKWQSLKNYSGCKIIYLSEIFESKECKNKCISPCFPVTEHIKQLFADDFTEEYFELWQQLILEQIKQWEKTGYRILIAVESEELVDSLERWKDENLINVEIVCGDIPHGIIFPEDKFIVISGKELFFPEIAKKRVEKDVRREIDKKRIEYEKQEYSEINEGDYVVHALYGIGIFHGLKEIRNESGRIEEVMEIEYADEVRIDVPLWRASLVTKHIGSGKNVPTLHKIGRKRWQKEKKQVSDAVKNMAAEMLKIQAVRSSNQGICFPKDDMAQKFFDYGFAFEETPDQLKAINEVKNDMSSKKIMDRLLCGDVGYGKTEVALRATFKAVSAGYQVAILVPTTVLAQQHYYTFMERFAETPFIVEMLSRFKTKREQKKIIERLKIGSVDIIIGTHKLLQPEVDFKKLGLIIIDEEQRFGVEHKEKIKRLKLKTDVLTMTATPIPRTLYMAMTGLRDLSTIVSPPGHRLPVRTIVAKYDEEIIKEAIEKELQRDGQVFFLHNRVQSIEETAEKIRILMPRARVDIAHGRMSEEELEKVMLKFLTHELDILVCTTIIESGIDIPNANTIIIERADRFGLSQLYQLRGRVGRSTRQAYAYFLLPNHMILTDNAKRRISAIKRYTKLGSGFKLAIKDMEIRGIGNLLGKEQSGYINTVGFELYCQMLRSAVNIIQGKTEEFLPEITMNIEFVDMAYKTVKGKLPAAFPPCFIPSEYARIDAYRRLSFINSIKELKEYEEELRDRYGKFPLSVRVLLQLTKIKVAAAKKGFKSLKCENDILYLSKTDSLYHAKSFSLKVTEDNQEKLLLIFNIISNITT